MCYIDSVGCKKEPTGVRSLKNLLSLIGRYPAGHEPIRPGGNIYEVT